MIQLVLNAFIRPSALLLLILNFDIWGEIALGAWGAFASNSRKCLKWIGMTPGQEEAAKREFVKEGLVLNFTSGSWYLGAYLGPRDQL